VPDGKRGRVRPRIPLESKEMRFSGVRRAMRGSTVLRPRDAASLPAGTVLRDPPLKKQGFKSI